jgi:hypothetical protein
VAAFISISLGFAGAASAIIVDGEVIGGKAKERGGRYVKLAVPYDQSNPPNTVCQNTFQSFNPYAFDEGQKVELPEDLELDIICE